MSDIRAEMLKRLRAVPGPWVDEPDRKEWRHKGVACLIVRNSMGALCGYAACPPGHPWHGKGYGEIEDVEVHGGLTYADACQGEICHVPAPGEPVDVWWLGFDCGHCFDLIPSLVEIRSRHDWPAALAGTPQPEVYRDIAYVTAQVELLAEQVLVAGEVTP